MSVVILDLASLVSFSVDGYVSLLSFLDLLPIFFILVFAHKFCFWLTVAIIPDKL